MFPFMTGFIGGKAFPTQINQADGNDGAATSTKTIPFGFTATAGRLLLVAVSGYSDAGIVWTSLPAGWTVEVNLGSSTAARLGLVILSRIAAGGESSISVSNNGVAFFAAYSAFEFTGAQDAEGTGTGATAAAAPNPPSETASWGADQNLWMVFAAQWGGSAQASAPANYSNLDQAVNSASLPRLSWARRELNAATEDPGAFGTAAGSSWEAATVVIRPS